MKKLIKYLIIGVVAVVVLLLTQIRTTSTQKAFDLDRKEKEELQYLVYHQNDADAAFKIALFYLYSEEDKAAYLFWLKVSSDLGNEVAAREFERKKQNGVSERGTEKVVPKGDGR